GVRGPLAPEKPYSVRVRAAALPPLAPSLRMESGGQSPPDLPTLVVLLITMPGRHSIKKWRRVGQHGLQRLFGVVDTLLSAPTDQAVRAHQHRTTRAYTIGRWPTPVHSHQVAASADTPCDQLNTQPVCHLQSGVAPGGAVGTGQQHEVLAEQDAGAQAFAV